MKHICLTCGDVLVGSSADGLCARCLLATALVSERDGPDAEEDTRIAFEPGTMIGSFRIERVIGRGGMSTVYEARDGRLERAIALKVLPPEFLHDPKFAERFEQEARMVAALEHPNIVPIHASGVDDGIPWMSMRLLTGGTIGDLLEDNPPDARRIVDVLRPVASALDYAHAHGIVHRDIKPTNVLFDGAERVYVGDFGLAYMLEAGSRMTQAGLLTGTPEYMAPEQALGKAVDHRCDIYSLAMVAYEMFAGVPPFTAESPVAILLKHVNDPLPQPPVNAVPVPVMRAIQKGSAKEPAERWQSATAFIDALDAAVSVADGRTDGIIVRSIQRATRRPMKSVASVAAAAVLAAATAGWLANREPGRRALDPGATAVPTSRKTSEASPTSSRLPEVSAPFAVPAAKAPLAPAKKDTAPATVQNTPPAVLPNTATPMPESPLAIPIAVSAAEAPFEPKATRDGDSPPTVPAPSPDPVVAPTRIRTVSPEYPQVARAAQLEGEVLLDAVVTADGRVTNVTVVRSVHPLLDEAARKAVLQYEYTPARRNGVPESAVVRETVSFRMR